MYCITQFGTIGTLFCAPDDERLDSFETGRADKTCGIKIDYKNCASRWSLAHVNEACTRIWKKAVVTIGLEEDSSARRVEVLGFILFACS